MGLIRTKKFLSSTSKIEILTIFLRIWSVNTVNLIDVSDFKQVRIIRSITEK